MRVLPRSLILLAVASTLVVSGCTDSSDTPKTPAAGQQPVTTESGAPTPSDSPTPTPTATTSVTPTPATLADRLLPTASVPGLNATWHWQGGVTAPVTDKHTDVCARGTLTDIGGTDAVSRTYFPPDDSDDYVQQQIADFPDAKTTATAWAVLGAWQTKCLGLLTAFTGPRVGPLTPIPLTTGQARWYLVTGRGKGEEVDRFYAIGMVRTGTRISVMQIFTTAKSRSYPTGQDPLVAMVSAAAPLLG